MKKNLLKFWLLTIALPVALLFTKVAYSQCPSGVLTIRSQTELDDFPSTYPGCTSMDGNLYISNVNNLDSLRYLTSISGYLNLAGSSSLTNVDGLSALTNIGGYLRITFNTSLTNLDGLSSLVNIGGYLHIENNLIVHLNGLSNLTSIRGYLGIYNNSNLSDVNGLSALENIGGYLVIRNNTVLTQIEGLRKVSSVGGYLNIQNNGSLASLEGLRNLESISGDLRIENNALTNLDGLRKLETVGGGGIKLGDNALLTDISGLAQINPATISTTGLQIVNNPNLSVCNLSNLCTYLAYPSGTHPRNISGNKTTCLNAAAIAATCSCPTGSYTFSSQDELDNFEALHGNCTNITLSNLVIGFPIEGNSSNINDLTHLSISRASPGIYK